LIRIAALGEGRGRNGAGFELGEQDRTAPVFSFHASPRMSRNQLRRSASGMRIEPADVDDAPKLTRSPAARADEGPRDAPPVVREIAGDRRAGIDDDDEFERANVAASALLEHHLHKEAREVLMGVFERVTITYADGTKQTFLPDDDDEDATTEAAPRDLEA
jgi:hypothetical protein